MDNINRREFLEISVAGAGTLAFTRAAATIGRAPSPGALGAQSQSGKPMPLGLIVDIDESPEAALAKVHELGVPTCQVLGNTYGPEAAERLREALAHYHLEVTSLVVTGPGPEDYDFYKGPLTIGLVPREYRATRIEHIKRASDFAHVMGFPAVQTHCGFIPENPNDPNYKETVDSIREVAGYCREHGQQFRYETGQETPITLLRAIQDVGLDNQGLNFDCGNLILYGKADPVDALDVIGKYVQGMYAKDGLYPTNPRDLGREVPIGQGKVNFPRLLARLKDLGYRGAVTIDREISGPKQMKDLKKEKLYLEDLINRTWAWSKSARCNPA